MTTVLLAIDSLINLVLGISLGLFPRLTARVFGMPSIDEEFYPRVLGAVLFGIGVALAINMLSGPSAHLGLGLLGAVTINLLAAIVITLWLVSRQQTIPVLGRFLLWGLDVILVALSLVEISVLVAA